jgi:AhpD family alkylhydroperoxidase
MTAPRIAPGGRRDVGLFNWLFAVVSARGAGTAGPPNLFLTLGRQRRMFRGWLHFSGTLLFGGRLPRRDTELVILRVANLRQCAYELEHHRHLAARAGLTAADIDRAAEGPTAAGWAPRQQAILTAVDELHRDGTLSDAAWAALAEHLDERTIIELVVLAGQYEMLATTIAALGIEPDRRR